MNEPLSRRKLLKAAGAAAFVPFFPAIIGCKKTDNVSKPWPILEAANTPKLCMGASRTSDIAAMRRIKQLGVDHVLMGGPPQPWTEAALTEIMDRFSANGLTVINMMIGGFPNTMYGLDGRDEEIEKLHASIIAAGNVGLPVI